MELTNMGVLGMSLFCLVLFTVVFDTFVGRYGAPGADHRPKPKVDLPTI